MSVFFLTKVRFLRVGKQSCSAGGGEVDSAFDSASEVNWQKHIGNGFFIQSVEIGGAHFVERLVDAHRADVSLWFQGRNVPARKKVWLCSPIQLAIANVGTEDKKSIGAVWIVDQGT